jgi:hypothetical protein
LASPQNLWVREKLQGRTELELTAAVTADSFL